MKKTIFAMVSWAPLAMLVLLFLFPHTAVSLYLRVASILDPPTCAERLAGAIEAGRTDESLRLVRQGCWKGEVHRKAMSYLPIHVAAGRVRPTVLKSILEHGGDPDARDGIGQTPLMWALAVGNSRGRLSDGEAEVIHILLEKRADVNAKEDLLGQTALDMAAGLGSPDAVRLLLERGADPNSIGKDGRTPLHRAAYSPMPGTELVVKELLHAGADPSIVDKHGLTPLETAMQQKNEGVVRVLRKAMRDFNR